MRYFSSSETINFERFCNFAKLQNCFEMKLRFSNNYILALSLLILIVICFLSINQPMQFDHERAQREKVVKDRLLKIRAAEEQYKQKTGVYCGNFAILVAKHYLADSLQYIPFTKKKRFQIGATTMLSKSGRQIPLMECEANYSDYLH